MAQDQGTRPAQPAGHDLRRRRDRRRRGRVVHGRRHRPLGRRPSPDLHEPRLERELRRHGGFVSRPATEDAGHPGRPVSRAGTRARMQAPRRPHASFTADADSNECATCDRTLVPSRFVVVCVRTGTSTTSRTCAGCTRARPGRSGRTTSSEIEARRSDGFAQGHRDQVQLRHATRIDGRRVRPGRVQGVTELLAAAPWLRPEAARDCDAGRHGRSSAAPRTSGSPTRPVGDLDPAVVGGRVPAARTSTGTILKRHPRNALAGRRSRRLGLAEAPLLRRRSRQSRSAAQAPESGELRRGRRQEFRRAGVRGARPRQAGDSSGRSTSSREPGRCSSRCSRWFGQVMLVKRLREVRALEGSRGLAAAVRRSDLNARSLRDDRPDWLPAIEVKGEGLPAARRRSVGAIGRAVVRASSRARWIDARTAPHERDAGDYAATARSRRASCCSTRSRTPLINQLASTPAIPRARSASASTSSTTMAGLLDLHGDDRLRRQPRRPHRTGESGRLWFSRCMRRSTRYCVVLDRSACASRATAAERTP